jgi:glutathione S-transferase
MVDTRLVVHGLDLSYFTGKLEAYLRAKGIEYELREMTTRSFRECGKATGFLQMPQVELADGTWLTDTTLIIRYLEQHHPQPAISPTDPLVRFISLLIEDFGDETLWRPALYYRWAYPDDARLMSGRIALGMMRDIPLPFFIRRQIILRRQQQVYMKRDGVTPRTEAAIRSLYLHALGAMEAALATNPFVMGDRPTEADFGLFGSMFRHFFSDPTPARLMRIVAPRTLAWVTRLWALTPKDFELAPPIGQVPLSCQPLLKMAAQSHLPYLDANARALAKGAATVRFSDHGADFEVPVSPYRAWCLAELQREYQALSPAHQSAAASLLADESACSILDAHTDTSGIRVPVLPISPSVSRHPRDRTWN